MKERIVMIGSGNVAQHLGKILHLNGHDILQVYSRNLQHAQFLANQLDAIAINSLSSIEPKASLYLFCIKDDAIGSLSAELTAYLPVNSVLAHTSGVNSPSLLDSYFLHRGLFYPLQSFSTNSKPDWQHLPIFVEGDDETLVFLETLAHEISQRVLKMDEALRTHLHLASVFANNFTNFNLVIARKILAKSEIPFDVLEPLMSETIAKAFRLMPENTQTGPAKRCDTSTIEKHVRLLVSEFPEFRSLYKKYSQIIQQEFKHATPGSNSTSTIGD